MNRLQLAAQSLLATAALVFAVTAAAQTTAPSLPAIAPQGNGNVPTPTIPRLPFNTSAAAGALGTQGLGTGAPGSANANRGLATSPSPATAALSNALELPPLPPLATVQFQQFVQESAGRSAPLFGYNLFERPRYTSLTDIPVPVNYVLGPGDELDIRVWGAIEFSQRVIVDRNGRIDLPRVGPISVAGVRMGELDAHLQRQTARIFQNIEITATMGRLRSIQVYLVGQARLPGAHVVSSLSTLLGVLFETGGPAATGSMRAIRLVRQGQTVRTIDLYRFIQNGDLSGDAPLQPGDVIVIPPAGPRVALLGSVDAPGIFELAGAGETVQQLLAYSGSNITLAAPNKFLLERIAPGQAQAPRRVEERSLDATGMATILQEGDVVTLLRASAEFANAVTLRGNVATPLRFAYRAGMRISDLIPSPDALLTPRYFSGRNQMVQPALPAAQITARNSGAEAAQANAAQQANAALEAVSKDIRATAPDVNWAYASIERLNRKELRADVIPFNLGLAIRDRDPAHNLELQPGDVVTVYSASEIPIPLDERTRLIKISGEVRAPGLYPVKPGERLQDLVNRAGGLTDAAYLYGATFTRESAKVQQKANLDQAVRVLESQLNAQMQQTLQNAVGSTPGAVVQPGYASAVQQVDRLRNLQPTGRIALDTDPITARLPNIELEDGDTLNVPPRPSLVMVYGAVRNESALLHQPQGTVANYIERAGLTRGADVANAVIIRANGLVVGNEAHQSWWGYGNAGFMRTRVYPGDMIFIPEEGDRRSAFTQFFQGAKDLTQVLYQLGLTFAAIRVLGN